MIIGMCFLLQGCLILQPVSSIPARSALEVSEDLNLKWTYGFDILVYGKHDYWTEYPKIHEGKYVGDCDDYAFTMKRLLGRGKVYAVAPDKRGRYHHAIFVDTDGNQYEVGYGYVAPERRYILGEEIHLGGEEEFARRQRLRDLPATVGDNLLYFMFMYH